MSDAPGFDELVGTEGLRDGAGAPPPPAGTKKQRIIRGSRLDRWWRRVTVTPRAQRAYRWGAPGIVVLVAILTRFVGLGHPDTIVFDETFYVKDAWSQWNLGYAATWPDDADAKFAAGQTDIFTAIPSFVVHPQLGKWITGLFMALLGPEHAYAWRVGVALAGVLGVVLIMLVAHRLFRSTLLAVIAGGLLAIDGNAIVMSRVALLDNYVMLFALLAFYLLLRDRAWSESRLLAWRVRRESEGRSTDAGPALWWRPWLMAAGLALGATASVKWNGIYFLAIWAVWSVVSDVLLRRKHGIPGWFAGTLVKQAPVSFLLTVPLAAAVYLLTWASWFTSDNSYDRHWAESAGNAWTGLWSWVPVDLQSFLHYEKSVWDYNIGESRPHPYQAYPATWLLMIRPTSMYYQAFDQGQIDPGQGACTAASCGESITGLANPLIWWGGALSILVLVAVFVLRRQWQVGAILMGIVAGYLPWLQYSNRTVFQFYTIAFEPYLVLALVAVLGIAIGSRRDPRPRRTVGLASAGAFLVLAVALSVFYWPLWTAQLLPYDVLRLHWWLPTWV
ncbi:phospholipid carrier-dependent glycosyltransferase [Galbitalea sp. SE-J8]|uniref:dolichyl-phosphate-mannose--protein mannosyltransferase n=1 Tax=Galbitalea sp. SE-J8 TaxID=3054952 RepID=UPI00259C92DD|nr:phospholipid carrier-dependent glycosyltransferase [Galbitalea sp. SE-J8]MDM4762112.1 phospholipid carrier-dependent glycosyltransferase [Galbitalea sp. SE-J8]